MKQEQILEKYYKLCVVIDVASQYLTEIEPHLKQLPKHLCKQALNYSNKLIKECDKSFNTENGEAFGMVADEFRNWIDENIVNSK